MPIERLTAVEPIEISWSCESGVATPTQRGIMWPVRARLRSPETNRPVKRMLSSRAVSAPIPTGLTVRIAGQHQFALLVTPPSLAEREIWLHGAPLIVMPGDVTVLNYLRLYSARPSVDYIEDETTIANLLVMR